MGHEQLVGFLTAPLVSAILITLGLGGILYAIKTGHLGAVALIGLGAIVLFFSAQMFADIASVVEVMMFVAGIALLAAEIFVIPGFGIVGVAGILLVVVSLFLALGGSFNDLSSEALAM